MNKRWNVDFWLTFQWFVAQIKCSNHRKGPRKRIFQPLPKSSFGRHKFVFATLLNSGYYIHATGPRNPRFKDAHTGRKRSLKAYTINRESGIWEWTSDDTCPWRSPGSWTPLLTWSVWRTKIAQIYGSPNEDFGNRNKRFGVSFRSTFQRVIAQIDCSHPWKVPRKDTPDLLFSLPKSSFGEHKIRCSFCNKFMLPKRRFWKSGQTTYCIRRFWKDEQTFQTAFSKHFSRAWVQDLGYETLRNVLRMHSEMLVRPSKIFVWGSINSEKDSAACNKGLCWHVPHATIV